MTIERAQTGKLGVNTLVIQIDPNTTKTLAYLVAQAFLHEHVKIGFLCCATVDLGTFRYCEQDVTIDDIRLTPSIADLSSPQGTLRENELLEDFPSSLGSIRFLQELQSWGALKARLRGTSPATKVPDKGLRRRNSTNDAFHNVSNF